MQSTPSTVEVSDIDAECLRDLVSDEISADMSVQPDAAATILAAFPDTAPAGPGSGGVLAGMFLRSITVNGFRGIGPKTTLDLQPAPGLTLVVGRNGCGKSSFAEAAEFAITGDNKRWSDRGRIWRDGWRNLHDGEAPAIEVELQTESAENPLTITGTWGAGAGLDDGSWTTRRKTSEPMPLDRDDLARPLELFRPFLSYSELGSLIDGTPTAMYDALHRLLGLDDLSVALQNLQRRRLEIDKATKEVKQGKEALLTELSAVDDDRARAVFELLDRRINNLSAISQAVLGAEEDASGPATALSGIAALGLPDSTLLAEATGRLDAAVAQLTSAATAEADADTAILEILDLAATYAADDCLCPVCGEGQLDAQWRERTGQKIADIRRRTADLAAARRAHNAAVPEARSLIQPVPQALSSCPIDADDTLREWRAWADLRTADAAQLPTLMRDHYQRLTVALSDLQGRARAELSRLDTVWAPLAVRIAAWVERATSTATAADELKTVKAAEAWLKNAAAGLRTERMRPLAELSQHIWTTLRQQSNVELGGVVLTGSAQQRRVSLDVTVDGVAGAALGVMSQGELHSLGLSLFLPRATAAQSPFRFLVIDDPVQSMDPAKVDGLARVLDEVARSRQVVVFTHDLRLSEAVRRLHIPATILDVQRRERSVVEVRVSVDPIRRNLADARALQSTPRLPKDEANELIALCCRQAIESASTAKVRKILGENGLSQIAIDEQLAAAERTKQKLALALFLDRSKEAAALARLDRELAPWASSVIEACNRGAHGSTRGDLEDLINRAERITAWLSN
ncbi:ATP-binding protein [Nocardia violaceofusca]|uniref:ATP-binding protein n=1 Tax=Nocardia violaceofusca TaxID=941182 RepID=UPI0007A3F29A|nr:ATP-binding protein [Nocardia violaceofusca]